MGPIMGLGLRWRLTLGLSCGLIIGLGLSWGLKLGLSSGLKRGPGAEVTEAETGAKVGA